MVVATERKCECGYPEKWAKDPAFPVEYDPHVEEYQIVHGGKRRWRFIMRYCPWCGGRLRSNRDRLFTTPSEAEKQEVVSLLAGAKSVEDVLRILGQPDEAHSWDDMDSDPASCCGCELKWVRDFKYLSRWTTLNVDILELGDGSITFAISGKYAGPRPATPGHREPRRRPWWKFWSKT
jgi:hypothetical protein